MANEINTAALKRYNDIMMSLCYEHRTIGTRYSEDTENWNLRDMVSEMQYTLDTWNDESSVWWHDAHDPYNDEREEAYREWYNGRRRMERFIARYEAEALTMECTVGHLSKYDSSKSAADDSADVDAIFPTCPNCGSTIVTGPEDIYYDDLGWHTLCPVCDCSFDVEPKQEWLDYDYKPAEPDDDDEDLPEEKDELKAHRAHNTGYTVAVDVYADTTDFYTEAECNQDNVATIRLPYNIVYDYTCLQAGYDVDVEAFDRWLSETCTCDDFLDLVWYARSKNVHPVKAGWSLADCVVLNDKLRSHATYAVLRDPDTDEYETLALARREDELTKDYNDRLLTTVAKHYAFNDCGGWAVEEIVIDGRKVIYEGWRPMMEIIFRYFDTGEIIYDVYHDEWDH